MNQPEFDVMAVVQQLMALRTLKEFEALLNERPEILGPQMLSFLNASGAMEGFGPIFRSLGNLLLEARIDPEAAWKRYQDHRSRTDALAAELETGTQAAEAAIAAYQFDEVIELVDRLLPIARETGLGLTIALLEDLRGQALFRTSSGDRVGRIESAIEGLSRALPVALDQGLRARVLMHLGLAFGERIRGDHAENVERSILYLQAALDEFGTSGPPDFQAIVSTNLAYGLIRRERGDRVDDLRQAVELCRTALQYRSPDRDADDWVYTQINLGDALDQLAQRDAAEPQDAEAAYEAVIAEQSRLRETWLAGVAHHSLARFQRSRASRGIQRALATGDVGTDADRVANELRESANEHLKAAERLTRAAPDRLRHARVLSDLAQSLQEAGEPDEALNVAREAMVLVEAMFDPGIAVSVGGTLGSLLAEKHEWAEAADAFAFAAETVELLLHSRLETTSREQEAKSAGNLHRWTAMALARAGRQREAALVLESGRTRELRRRFGLDPQTSDLPTQYCLAYEEAVQALATSPLGQAAAQAGRRLQEVLTDIRTVEGYEHFATGANEADLAGAARERFPAIYVNPTPWGTLLLTVSLDSESQLSIASQFLEVTSTEVFMWLSVAAPTLEQAMQRGGGHSFLAAVSGKGTADIRAALDTVLSWLGDAVARPIAETLQARQSKGGTLIPCGPIGTAPIHAAMWGEGERSRRLIDEFEVRYAPSATIASRSLDRAAANPSDPLLVALADPLGDLPAAGPEVDEIATYFGGREVRAYGDQANWSFLRAHAARATHLHLACHASGGIFDETSTGIALSDVFVRMDQLSELTGLRARLTTISACQTAIVDINNLPDEGLSIATVMIAAGSACAIASLWPVDDGATALLMIHLYEQMLTTSVPPPKALRGAQLWLQNLTLAERAEFVSGHRELATELARRANGHNGAGSQDESLPPGYASHTPYKHPYYWAGFVAVGA